MIEEEELIYDERLDEPMVWSASGMKTIASCGRQWHFRYRTDIKGTQTPYLAFGKTVHKVIEMIHQANDFSEDFWLDTWTSQWYEASEEVDFTGYYKGQFPNSAKKMLANYVKDNQNVNVLELEVPFPKGKEVYRVGPFVVRGVIDQIRRSDGGRLVVVDLKTSKYPPDPAILRADPQFSIYHYIAKQKYPGEEPLMALYHLESGKMFYTERTDFDVLMVESMIAEGQKKVDMQMFSRNVTANCRYCPFITQCLGEYEQENHRGLEILQRTTH
jgi:CRISPR/Cas system-associated exonuclease Cas4 (RecB family)